MRLPKRTARTHQESTITLINVVFLMLIFFLIAGSLTPPMDKGVALISTAESHRAEPPDALFVTAEGVIRSRGGEITPADYVAKVRQEEQSGGGEEFTIKIAADRNLAAERLIEIVGELRDAGANRITIVTQRETP